MVNDGTVLSQTDLLLVMVIEHYMEAASKGKDIVFCWVPSHVGISGNESADSTAKAALDLEGVHA